MMSGLPVFVEVFWKSTVALGAALGVCAFLRKRSADLRRLVLSTAIVAMFVAAVMFPALPRWSAVMPFWFRSPSAPAPLAPAMVDSPAGLPPLESQPGPSDVPFREAPRFNPDAWLSNRMPGVIPLIWFVGTAILLARFVIGLRGLRQLRNQSHPVRDAGLMAYLAGRRRVALLQSESIAAPVTWGMVRPVILVPAHFEQLPAECRDAVLCHELAHIQGHDFLLRVLAEIARAAIWFQPLMWITWRQLREEQELACDNRVLAAGGRPSSYAKLLLDWDGRLPGRDSLIAVGIAQRSCLKRRLYALLDLDIRRDAVSRAGVVAMCFLGIATTLPLASISLTHAAPAPLASTPAAQSTPAAPVSTAPEPQTQMAQVPAAPAPVQAPVTQPASMPQPKFDVVSVKRCLPGDEQTGVGGRGGGGGRGPRFSPGRLTIQCMDVASIISMAYVEGADEKPANNSRLDPLEERTRGGPAWMYSDWYTIEAETGNPEANGSTERGFSSPAVKVLIGPMLRAVLAERFHLAIHSEVEQVPMYALTVAKGGLKIQPLQEGDCRPLEPGKGLTLLKPGEKPICGANISAVNGPNRMWKEIGVSMKTFAGFALSNTLDRHVIDKTGVAGLFSFNLEYRPDETTPDRFRQAVDDTSAIPPGPAIFTALEQQLGLKLVPDKGPRGYFVIDHVERPSEN